MRGILGGLLGILVLISATSRSLAQPKEHRVNGKTLQGWLESLKTEQNPKVRALGLSALGAFALKAKAAVPLLLENLKQEKNPDLRWRIVVTLGNIGPEARAAVPQLRDLLKEKDVRLATFAAQALGMIGLAAAESIPDLCDAAVAKRCPSWGVVDALEQIGTRVDLTVPFLIQSLTTQPTGEHPRIIRGLAKIGGPAVPALVEALKNTKARRGAVIALGQMGLQAKPAIPELIALLKEDNDLYLPELVAKALGEIGPEASAAVPALAKLLESQDANVKNFSDSRRWALWALARIGWGKVDGVPLLAQFLEEYAKRGKREHCELACEALGKLGKPAVPELLRALKGKGWFYLRLAAVRALGNMRPEAKEAIPELVAAQKDPSRVVALSAALALIDLGAETQSVLSELLAPLPKQPFLGTEADFTVFQRFGPGAKTALPVLLNFLTATDYRWRWLAADALGGMGAEAKLAVPALTKLVNDKATPTATAAIRALGRIGLEAKEALPTLIEAFQSSKDFQQRNVLAEVIGSFGREAKPAVPALLAILRIVDHPSSEQVCQTLGQIGPEAKEALPALLGALEQRTSRIRSRAAKALAQIQGDPKVVLPALIAALKDQTEVRASAATALGNLGTQAAAAVPALLPLLKDSMQEVRRAAVTALRQIDPEAANKAGVDQ